MGFKQSPKSIYDTMIEDGISLKWKSEDFISLFKRCERIGFKWNPAILKFDRFANTAVLSSETPWCHCRPEPRLKCVLDHRVLFDEYGILSTRCLNCWKVVVRPRTFHELLLLEKLQNQMDIPCKCGIEVRDYVPAFYGGYFYNVGPDAGLKRCKEVREAVNEVISPEVDVFLKRGCTEYEFKRGDSANWNITQDQYELQSLIDQLVVVDNGLTDQPNLVKSHVRRGWMLWSHMNADFSYVEYNGGKKLFPDYRKYHDMTLEEIKEIIKPGEKNNDDDK